MFMSVCICMRVHIRQGACEGVCEGEGACK